MATRMFGGLAAVAILLVLVAASADAQRLPHLPLDGCRSEMDARLAFGLCPDSTFDFYASGRFREDVPTPPEVLGYPIGSWHTTYGRMERYLAAVAEAAPQRVRVIPYGMSIERQTMYLVAVGSEANLARLDEIREGTRALADPRRTSRADAESLAATLPVTVWLNVANDGNETAAFEAALQILYQLAAGEDERTRGMRADAVVLINMVHNPESHERHVAWYNGFVMGDANPMALEHRAPWGMSTNNNHYQIDLNRDALGLTQTETRAVAAEMQLWRPQVFVDLHGQTTQYFFPPAADPINPLYPESVDRWLDVFGRANAAAFDALGWSYYTRDVFDLFYPGYWDTYPTLHGSTGMTYETDGGGIRGVRWRRDDGTILSFADGIAGHFVASLATIEAAAGNREARLLDFHRFFADALSETGGQRAVVLLPAIGSDRLERLVATLLRHGIEVGRVTQGGTVSGRDYLTGERRRVSAPAGAYVVDFAQPAGRLARTLLEPEVPLPEVFVGEELARRARNLRRADAQQERHAFYDVTAWSLPLAAGVDALATDSPPGLRAEPLTISADAARSAGGWQGDLAWSRTGGVTGTARSAYVWPVGSLAATRLLTRLMDEGFNVAVTEREMVVADTAFPRGSFIARVGRNAPTLHRRVDELAREAGVLVYAAQTAFPERGATGTGSEATRTLRAPRIAVAAGEGVGITSYGALWFYLERRLGQPFTALRVSDIAAAVLSDYDVLVLPAGWGYSSEIASDTAAVREWIEGGGTLIAYGGAAQWVQGQGFGPTYQPSENGDVAADTISAILETVDSAAPDDVVLPPLPSPSARPEAPLAVPGAFLRGRLDQTHWLTVGYDRPDLPLLARELPLRASMAGANPVVYGGADDLLVSGFAWPASTERVYADRPYATVDRVGRGSIILFAEDPIFRIFFDAPAQLLWNAIYLGARGRSGGEY